MEWLSKIQAYIFDFDGTIIDNEQAHLYSWIEAFKILIGDINPSLIQHHFGKNSYDIASAFIQDKKQVEECVKIKEQIYEKVWRDMSGPAPCVRELLARLRDFGKTLAIASSSTYDTIVKTLQHFNLSHFFDIIVGIDNIPNPKPNPDLLLFILEKMSITPSNAVYIGDSPIDGLTARNAGVHFIYLNTYKRKNFEGKLSCTPDLAINSLCELLLFLSSL
ncbi:MAG: HAD family hydrolase [Candidatus Bathyarchaeia archaeon]